MVFLGKLRNVDPRIRSLFIVHTSMLIFSMGNSIIVTGIWPYLQAVSITIVRTVLINKKQYEVNLFRDQ